MLGLLRFASGCGLPLGVLAACCTVLPAQTFRIDTVAGVGAPGYSGDRGPAVDAHLQRPTAVAVDAKGNIYIADYRNSRIRKVDPKGIISTVAGNWQNYAPPLIGDGGPAIAAQLRHPYGVAVGGQGEIYIADQRGNRVRMVSATRKIQTIAGHGRASGPQGDGGPAKRASLAGPNDVAIDGDGLVYIADAGHHAVRRIGADGIITTFAGAGAPGFSGDGGPAAAAGLRHPSALSFDIHGNLYIADFGNHAVRRVAVDGTITTVAGTGERGFNGDRIPATEAQLNEPCGVAVDSEGFVYIADADNCRIRVVDTDGIIDTVAGTGRRGFSGDGGPAVDARINIPDIIDIDRHGNLYIADHANHRVRKLTRTDATSQ